TSASSRSRSGSSAWTRWRGRATPTGTPSRCRSSWAGCCAAAPTRSRAAGPAMARGPAQLMAYETLLVERRGPVGWLVFDRPDAGNAMDATMFRELEAAWRDLDDDPAVRVIVNTGNGRAFQTGVDVVQLGRDKRA